MSEINKHLKRTMFGESLKIEKDEEGIPKTLEGYFIVFNQETKLNPFLNEYEQIAPEAIKRSLNSNSEIKALFDHDASKVLGRTGNNTLKLTADEKGLYGVISINEKDQEALNLYERVKRKDIYQCSFGFMPLNEEVTETKSGAILTTLRDMELYEVSVVTFPAYNQTSVEARNKFQYSEKVKEDKLRVRKNLFIKQYRRDLEAIKTRKIKVDPQKVQLRTAKIIKKIFSDDEVSEVLSNYNGRQSLPSNMSRKNQVLWVREFNYDPVAQEFNCKTDNITFKELEYRKRKKEIRSRADKLEKRLMSHDNELRNSTTDKQFRAEKSNIEKVIELIEKELTEIAVEEEAFKEYEELLDEAYEYAGNPQRGFRTRNIITDIVSSYLQQYVYEVTGEDIVERTIYDENYRVKSIENAKGQTIATIDDTGELKYKSNRKNKPKKVRGLKGANKMEQKDNNYFEKTEARSELTTFLKTKGREKTSLRSTDLGIFIPDIILYSPEVRINNLTDLKPLCHVVAVEAKSGSFPIPKRAKEVLHTVEQLQETPILGHPKWLPVKWEVETYRGALPISQEIMDDSLIDLTQVVLENAREQRTNTTNLKIAEVYKTFTPKTATNLDDLKSIINVDLSADLNTTVVASQSFFHELDTLKDDMGRYLLQPDASSPSGKTLNGIPIVKVADELLGTKGEMKAFIGDTYRAVLFVQRLNLELEWRELKTYETVLMAISRFVATKADDEAGFFVTWEPEIQA